VLEEEKRMRDLARSLSSFSWALSLFGAQQTFRWLRSSVAGGTPPSMESLGSMAQAAQGSLEGVFLRTFEAGDQIQKSALDMAFSLASPDAWTASRFAALSSRALQQSTAALGRLLPGGEARW
jgi:hypothetical protein